MKSIVESIEPALCLAREELAAPEKAAEALAACAVFLELHRMPVYARYNPAKMMRQAASRLSSEQILVDHQPGPLCQGDEIQVARCIEVLAAAAVLDADTMLLVELGEENGAPVVWLELDGPGICPERFTVRGCIDWSMDALAVRWTAATKGGRIDRTPNGLVLRLTGMREVPELKVVDSGAIDAVERAATLLSEAHTGPVREALDHLLEQADAALDGGRGPEPADVPAVVNEALDEMRPVLEAAGLTCEVRQAGDIPPILMRRGRVRSAFANALGYAAQTLSHGGAVTAVLDYDAVTCTAGAVITLGGTQWEARPSALPASIRRAVVEVQGGSLDIEKEGQGAAFVLGLPDAIGGVLAEWVPGFHVFTAKSRQALRLVKSPGAGLPEDVVLPAVLEQELEHWLLPLLGSPAARNCAHELTPEQAALPGGSAERSKKALGQVKRGKPRKEVCAPAYAAELIWAFSRDDHCRRVLGADALDDGELEELCRALLQSPPGYRVCLAAIAKALTALQGA